jgi:hypothetical protein
LKAFKRTRTRGSLILKIFKKLEIKGFFFKTNVLKEIKTSFYFFPFFEKPKTEAF